MCKVYNTIGSLTSLKLYLHKNNVFDFKSLKEVINFKKNYSSFRQQIISKHSFLISQEKITLKVEIEQLDTSIEIKKREIEKKLNSEINHIKQKLKVLPSGNKNFIISIYFFYKKIIFKINIRIKEKNLEYKVNNSVKVETSNLNKKRNRYQFIQTEFNLAVDESSVIEIKEHDRKKTIIDEVENYIYGALGEHKVVKELEKLPDNYNLINDFTYSLDPPVYNKAKNYYIKSVQIDHILVTPSGVFIIETKNWNENSVNSSNLHSPVAQVRRANFVMFKILAGDLSNSKLNIKHHWGERKIPLRNVIVLVNHKPIEEFKYVKIVNLKELLSFIEHFTPCFSDSEIECIAKYLININNL